MDEKLYINNLKTFLINNQEEFENIKLMPKLEFHGHLNGLISNRLLDKYIFSKETDKLTNLLKNEFYGGGIFSYDNFFKIVKKVSVGLQTHPQFKIETLEDIAQDYLNQNCVYLELRDTPRENSELNYSIYDYLSNLLDKANEIQNEYKDKMLIRFFINLHKAESMKDYNEKILEAFKLLPDHLKKFILGIDVGGQDLNNFNYFCANKKIYSYFKDLGYKINFHLYENPEENYFKEILEFKPAEFLNVYI